MVSVSPFCSATKEGSVTELNGVRDHFCSFCSVFKLSFLLLLFPELFSDSRSSPSHGAKAGGSRVGPKVKRLVGTKKSPQANHGYAGKSHSTLHPSLAY